MEAQKNKKITSESIQKEEEKIVDVFEELFSKRIEATSESEKIAKDQTKDKNLDSVTKEHFSIFAGYEEKSDSLNTKSPEGLEQILGQKLNENTKQQNSVNDKELFSNSQEMYQKSIKTDYINSITRFVSVRRTVAQKIKDFGIKNLIIIALSGLLINATVDHYSGLTTQRLSQKFVTGLMYNLSETNDLNIIARNIFLGMGDAGWKPDVIISNNEVFSFRLRDGGEFTIIKNYGVLGNVSFHVEVVNFSKTMLENLEIALSPVNFGGTNNFIMNKTYDSRTKIIAFDIDKLSDLVIPISKTLPMLRSQSEDRKNSIQMMSNVPPIDLSLPPVEPNITQIPISERLKEVMQQQNQMQQYPEKSLSPNKINKNDMLNNINMNKRIEQQQLSSQSLMLNNSINYGMSYKDIDKQLNKNDINNFSKYQNMTKNLDPSE